MNPDDIKDVIVLHAQPGDAIVLKVDRQLSDEQRERFKAAWMRHFTGSGIGELPLVILDEGVDLSIVRTENPWLRAIRRIVRGAGYDAAHKQG